MSAEILRCIGRAVVKNAARAMLKGLPLGEALCDVAGDFVEAWKRQQAEAIIRRAELEALARAPAEESHRQALRIAREEAPPELQRALTAYLGQVPQELRRLLSRRADPSGRTVPVGLGLEEARDVLAFLPPRSPRFQPGDHPLPETSWMLERLLGIGGFGEVWKAFDPTDATILPVALKFAFDEDAVGVLRHEQVVLERVGRAGHLRGIVPLRQAHLEADPPCLEYEFVEGTDLGRQIREWAELPVAERLGRSLPLLHQLAEVMAHPHALSPPVVHRDLKPANILLLREERALAVRVTDFGIGGVGPHQAWSQTNREYEADLLTRLRGAYTPFYASPQQVSGAEPDPRDDVFAMGVIGYQMLTGDLRGKPPADWKLILEEQGVPAGVIEVLRHCLATRADRRFANAGVLARELAPWLPAVTVTETVQKVDPWGELVGQVVQDLSPDGLIDYLELEGFGEMPMLPSRERWGQLFGELAKRRSPSAFRNCYLACGDQLFRRIEDPRRALTLALGLAQLRDDPAFESQLKSILTDLGKRPRDMLEQSPQERRRALVARGRWAAVLCSEGELAGVYLRLAQMDNTNQPLRLWLAQLLTGFLTIDGPNPFLVEARARHLLLERFWRPLQGALSSEGMRGTLDHVEEILGEMRVENPAWAIRGLRQRVSALGWLWGKKRASERGT